MWSCTVATVSASDVSLRHSTNERPGEALPASGLPIPSLLCWSTYAVNTVTAQTDLSEVTQSTVDY